MTIPEQIETHRGSLGLAAFAEIVGVSYATAYRWVQYAGLPATKITSTYHLDPVLAARWWREHSTLAKPPALKRFANP